jgi:3'-phosphoadenosine 5'-phosphosulfate (PAPS) 3'-phosphatase
MRHDARGTAPTDLQVETKPDLTPVTESDKAPSWRLRERLASPSADAIK